MKEHLRYLVLAEKAEVEERLRGQSYQVRQDVDGFDMVATKPGHRIVYQFTAQEELGAEKELVLEKRARARSDGADEFRLVVVTRPHRVEVRVDGLQSLLCKYLASHLPPELEEMSHGLTVESVEDIDYDALHVRDSEVRLRGTATVEVLLGRAEGRWRDFSERHIACPLRFDVTLGRDNDISEVSELQVDTDSCF